MTAVDDVSFYNIFGEEVSRLGLVQQMVDYYSQKLEVGETKVTDFNEGSEIRNLLEAFAVDIYGLLEDQYELSKIAFITTAYGEWLDLHGENPLLATPRNQGQEATGILTFSIPEVSTGDYVIPEGTLVGNEEGLEFVTDMEAYIVAGDTSVDVPATCLTIGADGNVKANTITIIDDSYIDSSITVTNNNVFINGEDYEDDDTYRDRLLNTLQNATFGSLPYYISLAESIDGVHDVLFVDDANYTKKIFVNGNNKPVEDTVLVNVLTEFSDTPNIVAGHSFMVAPVNYHDVDLTVNLNVETLLDEDIINEVMNCFFNGGTTSEYFEYAGFDIGESLNRRELYFALELMDWVVDVMVIDNATGEEVTTITPNGNAVLRLVNCDINQTEV